MAWDPLSSANVAAGKFWTTTIATKIKDCLEYLYGLTNGTVGNQILNGSFELDSDSDGVPDNWTPEAYAGGTVSIETTAPDHGAKALKFVHPGGASNGGGYADSDYLEVSELETNTIRFIHWASAAGMKNKVQIRYFTKAKIELGAGSPADVYNSTSNPTSPTQFVYQFTPLATARYIKVRVIGGYTDTNVAGSAYFDGIRIDPALITARIVDAQITQAKLKTSTGAVSTTASGSPAYAHLTLPGGEYGFWPQVKVSSSVADETVTIMYSSGLLAAPTSYTTLIHMGVPDGYTTYAQQRYVTSSGEVFWIYILRDKITKKMISTYCAPDHPCFGNSGKPLVVPHPFYNYDTTKHEIVVINPLENELKELESKCPVDDETKPDLSLIEVVNNLYEIDEKAGSPDWPTIPVTVGLPQGHDWKRASEETKIIPIKKVIPKTDYITTKTLRLK